MFDLSLIDRLGWSRSMVNATALLHPHGHSHVHRGRIRGIALEEYHVGSSIQDFQRTIAQEIQMIGV